MDISKEEMDVLFPQEAVRAIDSQYSGSKPEIEVELPDEEYIEELDRMFPEYTIVYNDELHQVEFQNIDGDSVFVCDKDNLIACMRYISNRLLNIIDATNNIINNYTASLSKEDDK